MLPREGATKERLMAFENVNELKKISSNVKAASCIKTNRSLVSSTRNY